MPSNPCPLRGGRTGGSDEEVDRVATSSAGEGDFDFDLKALLPDARRSQDGLAFVAGLGGRSGVDEEESSEEVEVAAGEGIGFVTSA